MKRELAELQTQFARLSQTERGAVESVEGNVEVPTGRVAAASIEYLQATRELKYHESLYDFLSRQLEAARIDEAKNAVLVQVVDRAVVPERKSSPQRLLIVAVAAVLAFCADMFRRSWCAKPSDARSRTRWKLSGSRNCAIYLRSPLTTL